MGTFNITANVILHQKQNMKVFFLVNRVFGQKFIKKMPKNVALFPSTNFEIFITQPLQL